MTKEELRKSLESYQTEEKGNTFTVFTTEDRVELLKKIAKSLKAIYNPTGKSSVGNVKAGSFTILAKRPKGESGGSGAGTYMTAVAESAQCYYCAASWYGKDFSDKTLRSTAKYVRADISVDEVIKNLSEQWIDSCVKTAQALKSRYGTRKYIFHRGSSLVDQLTNNFNEINRSQKLKLFSNINKWSPADIYMMETKEEGKISFNFKDLNGLNSYITKKAKEGSFIGVSLKQTKSATLTEVNFNAKRPSYAYVDSTLGKKGYFEAKDVFVFFDEYGGTGSIQFRGFPVWQGEIKGKTANHGKISGGPIKTIVDKYSAKKLSSQAVIESKIKTKNKQFYKDFYEEYKKGVGKSAVSYDNFFKTVSVKDINWQSSKYLGTELINILKNSKNRQLILSSFINYAKSQSEESATYIKVS